jgi:glycosyltransferase involved in cell wall biosynthesis
VGLRLKRNKNIKLIFDMRGFWADERVEGRIWSLDHPLYRWIYKYFKRAERRLVELSDHVIVLTQAAKTEIASWQLTSSITVIPCCVDINLFKASRVSAGKKLELRNSMGIGPNDFVLLYLGSLGTWYMKDEMLAFYQALRLKKPNARFLCLTPDVDEIAGEGIILRTVQRSDVPDYIALADASICFIRPTFSKKGSSATKMAEVLAMNVPIISNSGWGDVEFLRPRVNGLVLIPKFDDVPDELLQYSSADRMQTQFFFEFFSLEQGIKKYEQVYNLLTGTKQE